MDELNLLSDESSIFTIFSFFLSFKGFFDMQFKMSTSNGAGVQAWCYKRDRVESSIHTQGKNKFYFLALVTRQSAELSFVIQHPMLPKSGGKWGVEYLNTRHPSSQCLLCYV